MKEKSKRRRLKSKISKKITDLFVTNTYSVLEEKLFSVQLQILYTKQSRERMKPANRTCQIIETFMRMFLEWIN